jgi:predicted nucleic acid-binding protein
MPAPALICDTGALLDYLCRSAPDHAAFRQAIDDAGTRYVPGLVLAELDYFLRQQRKAMASFVDDMRRSAFTYVPPSAWHICRAMEIDRRWAALGLGLVDASIVAVAEEVGVSRLATRDIRHFTTVRLRDAQAFELVVHPSRPDGSRC